MVRAALLTNKQAGFLALGAVVAAYVVYQNRGQIGRWLNPASSENVAYQGVNAVGSELSGDDSWTLGGWFYDLTHPHEKYKLNPEQAPYWWLLENPQYLNSDTIAGG